MFPDRIKKKFVEDFGVRDKSVEELIRIFPRK